MKQLENEILLNKITMLLFCGLFLGLVSSQSLMDFFAILTSLWSLFRLIKFKEFNHLGKVSKFLFFSLVWVLVLYLGLRIQIQEGTSAASVLTDFVWIIHLPLWFYLWSKVKLSSLIVFNKKWTYTAIGLIVLASAYAIFVYIIGFNPLHQKWSDRSENLSNFWRTGGLFSNPMALAHSYGPIAMALLPISVYFLYTALNKVRVIYINKKILTLKKIFLTPMSWLIPMACLLLLIALLFTFTRGVWLSLIFASLIGSFIFNRRVGLIFLSFLIVGGMGLFASWPKFRERTIQVFDDEKSYDSERVIIWKTNWSIFIKNPVFGIGYGENVRLLRKFYNELGVPQGQFESHAHNQILHYLSGTGITGLFFYLCWCFFFLRMNYKIYLNWRHKMNRNHISNENIFCLFFLGLFLAQVAFHIGSLTESNFIIAKNRMLLVFIWSLVLYFYFDSANQMTPTDLTSERINNRTNSDLFIEKETNTNHSRKGASSAHLSRVDHSEAYSSITNNLYAEDSKSGQGGHLPKERVHHHYQQHQRVELV